MIRFSDRSFSGSHQEKDDRIFSPRSFSANRRPLNEQESLLDTRINGRSIPNIIRELEVAQAATALNAANTVVDETNEISEILENESLRRILPDNIPVLYPEPLDLVHLNKLTRTFSIADNQASVAVAFIAGPKYPISNGAEFDALADGEWAISSAISDDTYVYIQLNRTNKTALLRAATTTFPNGTDPIDNYGLYYIPANASYIEPGIIDMRRVSFHWIAGA